MAVNGSDASDTQAAQVFLPVRTAWAEPFWSGLAAGDLWIQQCRACDRTVFPPVEEICPHCSAPYSWRRASGKARLWSWTTFHREYYPGYPVPPPYTVLMVAIEEGLHMLGALASSTPSAALRCDMPLEFSPLQLAEGVFVPGFRPVG